MPQREEGRGELGKCPRRMDTQKAKIKSKLRWMEAYTQGSLEQEERKRVGRVKEEGRMTGFSEDKMCP